MKPRLRFGVDLGGTKIALIALAEDGEVLLQQRVSTPARTGYQAIIHTIRDLVLNAEHQLGAPGTVGVGLPGALSPDTGRLRNSNTSCLNGQPIDEDLGQALGRQIRIANDADCFALSEASDGAGAGAAVVFGVITGTGTGGGLVVRRELLSGPNRIAGEWGHTPLPWPKADELPGPPCYCGRLGCIETWLSGPGLAADHLRVTSEVCTGYQVGQEALAGSTAAIATLRRHAERFARALAVVIDIVDPNVIVLGGGVSQIEGLVPAIKSHWGQHVFSDAVRTELKVAKYGDDSGVRGAAWLWPMSPPTV